MEDEQMPSSAEENDVPLNDTVSEPQLIIEEGLQPMLAQSVAASADEEAQFNVAGNEIQPLTGEGLQTAVGQSVAASADGEAQFNVAGVVAQPLPKVGLLKRDKGLSSLTGGLAYSLVVILFIGLSLLMYLIQKLAHIGAENEVFSYLSMLIAPLAITVTIIVILATRKVKFKEICPVKTHPKYYLIAVLLTVGLIFIGSIASSIFIAILGIFGYSPSSEGFMPDVSGVKIIPAIICTAVVPAFFEELFFRGLILHSTEKSMGSIRAILVTGFSFALMHGSPMQTVHQFLLGCAIAFLTIRSGSVLPGMLAHFLNNLIAVIMLAFSDFLYVDMSASMTEGFALIMSGVMLLTITGTACAFIWLTYDKKKPLLKCNGGGVRTYFIGASVGIGLMSVMWLLDFIIGCIHF